MIRIYTVPAGANEIAAPGTIFGVLSCPNNTEFSAETRTDVAIVTLPADTTRGASDLIGDRITPLAGGDQAQAFADNAAFESDVTPLPDKYRRQFKKTGTLIFFNGSEYVTDSGFGLHEAATLTIVQGGTGYSTTAETPTAIQSSTGADMTVQITSVGASGDITGVAIVDAGIGYTVGDTLFVVGGSGGIVEITGLNAPKFGTLNTGRGGSNQAGPDDLNPSYFSDLPGSYAPDGLELFVPTTGQVMPYNPNLSSPYTHDSYGNCFNGVDYTLQIRIAGTTDILAELTVPNSTSNVDVDFSRYEA